MIRFVHFFCSILIVAGCSNRTQVGTGSGSATGSANVGSSAPHPHEEMAVVPAGTYLLTDPAFAPDNGGACPAETIAKVKALAMQLPWPDRQQDVPSFLIDKRRITRSEYRACVTSGACPDDKLPFAGSDDAAQVTMEEAVAYCRWRGAKLPTLLQWQAAIRGTTGQTSAKCDDPRRATDCTVTNGAGVRVAIGHASPGEFTSTMACWYAKHGEGGTLLPLMALPLSEQLYMFSPDENKVAGEPAHGEFRCARNQVAATTP